MSKIENKTKEENDKRAARGRVLAANLKEIKAEVKKHEIGNTSVMMAFRSRGGWWKMGGNSALIYYYKIAPELGKKPKLNRDSDFFEKFHEGVISIKNIDKLAKELEGLGIKCRKGTENSSMVRIFELVEECSEEEIKEIRKIERQKNDELNKIVAPKLLLPRVGVILKDAAVSMYRFKIPEKNPRATRLVDNLVAEAMEMAANYVMACKNQQGTIEDLEKASRGISRLMSKIELVKDMEIWDVDKCVVVCDRLDEAQKLLNKKIKTLKKKEKEEDERTEENAGGDGEERGIQELVISTVSEG